ncbi:hypothetical protein [Corynebacterium bovis]|uniref:hypothetical protein n=1 Tax=Corynebacterium bovis TaxID=36808 RepID=UPI000F64C860|nr:hypothetical protein [Corynebacterium bovis]
MESQDVHAEKHDEGFASRGVDLVDALVRQVRGVLPRPVMMLAVGVLLACAALGGAAVAPGGNAGTPVVGVAIADPAEAPGGEKPADGEDKPGLLDKVKDTGIDTIKCLASNPGQVGMAGCTLKAAGDAAGAAVGAAKDKVGDAVEGQFKKAIVAIGDSALRFVMWMLSFWLERPSNIVLSAGKGVDAAGHSDGRSMIFDVQDYTIWVQALLGVVSLIAIGVRFTLSRWSEAEDNVQDFVRTLGRIIVTSAVWIPGVILATRFTDGLGVWILDGAKHQASEGMRVFLAGDADMPDGWKIASSWGGAVGNTGMAGVVLIGSILSMIASLAQILFSFMREAMLVILAAVMPILAYASGTSTGREAYDKAKGWTLALLLFKPAAALVYAIAFMSVKDIGDEDSMSVLGILVLFGLAAFCFPALLSLVAPPAGVAPAGPSAMRVAGSVGGGVAAGAAASRMFGGGAFGSGGSKAAAANSASAPGLGAPVGGPGSGGGGEGSGGAFGGSGGGLPGGPSGGGAGGGSAGVGESDGGAAGVGAAGGGAVSGPGGLGVSAGESAGGAGAGGDTGGVGGAVSPASGGDAAGVGSPGAVGGDGGAASGPAAGGGAGEIGSPAGGGTGGGAVPGAVGGSEAGASPAGGPSAAGGAAAGGGSAGGPGAVGGAAGVAGAGAPRARSAAGAGAGGAGAGRSVGRPVGGRGVPRAQPAGGAGGRGGKAPRTAPILNYGTRLPDPPSGVPR